MPLVLPVQKNTLKCKIHCRKCSRCNQFNYCRNVHCKKMWTWLAKHNDKNRRGGVMTTHENTYVNRWIWLKFSCFDVLIFFDAWHITNTNEINSDSEQFTSIFHQTSTKSTVVNAKWRRTTMRRNEIIFFWSIPIFWSCYNYIYFCLNRGYVNMASFFFEILVMQSEKKGRLHFSKTIIYMNVVQYFIWQTCFLKK